MSEVTTSEEFKVRIEKLEQFKHEVEKKLYAAIAVATVLGVASVIGGAWVTSLTRDLADLSAKTEKLQASLKQWDQQLVNSLAKMEDEKNRVLGEIDTKSKAANVQLAQESERIASQHQLTLGKTFDQKRLEATRPSLDGLIAKLTDGSLNLVVRDIQVRNSKGVTTVVLATDEQGDGFIRVNTDKGERRYLLSLSGKRAQSHFYGLDGKQLLTTGVFTDDNIGFVRLRDPTDTTTLLELKSDGKGGILSSYSPNGKNIVYVGPDANTGNGLVNVMGIHGESTASHAPK
jgi:hypothetical protein